MYDANTLRRQIEEAWSNFIVQETESRRERATKYKTKKIMMQAHGVEAYYEIEFPLQYLALSHRLTPLTEIRPLEDLLESPLMIGVLGAIAELIGQVEQVQEEEEPEEAQMDEEMFFAQHFTSSLSDAVSGLNKNKKKKPGIGI